MPHIKHTDLYDGAHKYILKINVARVYRFVDNENRATVFWPVFFFYRRHILNYSHITEIANAMHTRTRTQMLTAPSELCLYSKMPEWLLLVCIVFLETHRSVILLVKNFY